MRGASARLMRIVKSASTSIDDKALFDAQKPLLSVEVATTTIGRVVWPRPVYSPAGTFGKRVHPAHRPVRGGVASTQCQQHDDHCGGGGSRATHPP